VMPPKAASRSPRRTMSNSPNAWARMRFCAISIGDRTMSLSWPMMAPAIMWMVPSRAVQTSRTWNHPQTSMNS